MASNLLGEVDLLGLNEFGENPGLSPLYGALIGAGVSNLTAIATRQLADPGTSLSDNADAVGFGVGMLASAAMWFMGAGTRHASIASAAAVALSTGLRAIEKMFLSGSSAVHGFGLPQIQNTPLVMSPPGTPQLSEAYIQPTPPVVNNMNPLGAAMISPVPGVYGPHLGAAVVNPTPGVYGAPGLAGPQIGAAPPINTGSPNPSAGAQQAAMLLGLGTSDLASAYGVTLFGTR